MNRHRLLFSERKCMRPRVSGRRVDGGGEVLMQNKVSVLFVLLRPSKAIFFFFFKSNLYMTVISSVRQKTAITVFAQKG